MNAKNVGNKINLDSFFSDLEVLILILAASHDCKLTPIYLDAFKYTKGKSFLL